MLEARPGADEETQPEQSPWDDVATLATTMLEIQAPNISDTSPVTALHGLHGWPRWDEVICNRMAAVKDGKLQEGGRVQPTTTL